MKKAWLTIASLCFGPSAEFILRWSAHSSSLWQFLSIRGRTIGRSALFFRNILRLAGVRFEVRRSPGFDPNRTSIFICNHVNIFDPFVVYSAIPQFLRGFELESHFKIPIYGWMMGRFGNIPVPDAPSREGLEIMTQRAKAALDSGISLIAFAEGSRTRRRPRAAVQERNFQPGAEIRRSRSCR